MEDRPFESLDSVDRDLAAKVRRALIDEFVARAGLPSAVRSRVAQSLTLEAGRNEIRVSLADLGEFVASWDGSEADLLEFARERGQSYAETYREDRARYGTAMWG